MQSGSGATTATTKAKSFCVKTRIVQNVNEESDDTVCQLVCLLLLLVALGRSD